jgi:murein DD-endopeptidase MepM/ murein hydrolase activator NlpD
MVKKILVFARKSMKLTILIAVSIFLIICAVALFFKPIYSVTINDEFVGYSKDKSKLQARINTYIENGDGEENDNIAFVQVDNLPEYKMCLLKRNIVTNDDEIFEKIKESGITYYKYYAILEGEEEKAYVSDFASAEQIVNQLKEKQSTNISTISILELYETDLIEFATVEDTVASLYVKKEEPAVAKTTSSTKTTGSVNTSTNVSYQKVGLGINLIKPISGTITSRFGAQSSIRVSNHTGLDIAAPKGTVIKAAASGTVTFSGRKGSYGYLMVISHGNGVETYYGHCSKLYYSAGTTVSQGQAIAEVGSTGNSTGNHLHLEVRINGVAYNPQNYVY